MLKKFQRKFSSLILLVYINPGDYLGLLIIIRQNVADGVLALLLPLLEVLQPNV